MRKRSGQNGFTLVEMMVALMVCSIVLAAVAVLANATAIASESTDQMGLYQSHLRLVSDRVSDLVRRANRVMSASAEGFELWHDVNGDGLAVPDELTVIGRGADGHTLVIGAGETHAVCRNVVFAYDAAAPATGFVTVWYDLTEDGQTQRYSVCAQLRGSAAHRKF